MSAGQNVELLSRSEPSLLLESGGGSITRQPLSADGRYLVFTSASKILVPGQIDANEAQDVFQFDRATGEVLLVSHVPGSGTTAANGYSRGAAISDDGNWVVFVSAATNLVAGQVNGAATLGVFLFERATGEVRLVSHAAGSLTILGNGSAAEYSASNEEAVSINADGSLVAFTSAASDHVGGQSDTNGVFDVFLFSRATGEIKLVSHSAPSVLAAGNGVSRAPRLSANGTVVVFASLGTNLVTGQVDSNAAYDVFAYDASSAVVVLVSHSYFGPGTAGNAAAIGATVSADGRFISFSSNARTLVIGMECCPAFVPSNVFVFDRSDSSIRLLTYAAGTTDEYANNDSRDAWISRDGNWIAFTSMATDLISGVGDPYPNGPADDVFLAERATGQLTLVSRSFQDPQRTGNGRAIEPQPSSDGGYVVFSSWATDHVAGQVSDGFGEDVFVFERATGALTLVSHGWDSGTAEGDNRSRLPVVSADGAHVAFVSLATNLVDGWGDRNLDDDVFLWDRTSALTVPASRTPPAPPSATAAGMSRIAGIIYGVEPYALRGRRMSGDGRYVVFESSASNLVPGQEDPYLTDDVFLFDRHDGSLRLVSHEHGSANAATGGSDASMSADGAFILFESYSSKLVPGVDPNGFDVFLFERATGLVRLVSRAGNFGAGGFASVISADGGYVAFTSLSGIGQVDFNSQADVYLFERATGTVSLVSRRPDGMAGSARSFMPRIDAAGRYVVFLSEANDLVPGQVDSGARAQVFLFDRLSGTTTLVSRAAGTAATESDGYASGADISAAGHRIVFESSARDLLPGQADTLATYDVFLYDTFSGTTTLVSRTADGSGLPAGGTAGRARISADGGSVIFGSFAPNLVSGQSESEFRADLFLYDVNSGGMTLVSHAHGAPTTATEAEFWPGNMAVSDDGAYVVFMSTSPDLLPGANAGQQGGVWIFERETGLISLASRNMFGIAGRSGTLQADISADGNYVAFDCEDANVVPSDLNGTTDAFLFGPIWSSEPDLIFWDGFEPT